MSDSFSQTNIENNQIIERFIAQSLESFKIERPHLVALEILKWTRGNTLLTESLCQIILERQDQVIEGQERSYVERIVRSLVKYWEIEKSRAYYPHLKSIKADILQNQQLTSVLLRLHEILLQKEVTATENLEDIILLNSGLVIPEQDQLKIANPIYAAIFNSEWIKQQLSQISGKLIVAPQELVEVELNNNVESKKIPTKVWAIIALIGLGIVGGIVSFLPPISDFSAVKKCRLAPTDLDLAAKVLVACDRVISRQPDNTEALMNRGKVSLVLWNASHNQARIYSAVNDFTQARKLEPNNPRAAFYQSYLQEFQELVVDKNPNCTSASDRYQEAIKLYQPFDKLSEADIPLVLELGYFSINREQDYQTAIKIFDAVIKFNPKLYQAWAGKATAQFLSKDYFSAKESLNRALALNPNSYKLKYNLGSLWAKLGNYNQASQLYEQVTKIEPDFALAWRDLGLTLYLQNQYQAAALAFTRIVYRPNSQSFHVSDRDRALMTYYYERSEDCLHEKVKGLDISCSQENRMPMELNLNYKGVFHNIIVRGVASEPFFEVKPHKFFQCFRRDSQAKN
ncbi:MAG: tetratricopeptide repeat protein [Waterburya sp.]